MPHITTTTTTTYAKNNHNNNDDALKCEIFPSFTKD